MISLLVTWVECTLSKSAGHTKLCCAVKTPEGRDAIHRELDRLERWDCVNLMESSRKPRDASSSEDMELEQVQRRFMKMIKRLDHFHDGTGLKEFGLFSLKKKWLRRDLIALSSTRRDYKKAGEAHWAGICSGGTSRNILKLKDGIRIDIRQKFLTIRVMRHLNRFLPHPWNVQGWMWL